jgi:threonine/homoserine/homoserine lactone efflux protein
MLGIHHFALFLTTGILLNLTPGPDTAYILGRSIAQGRRAGVASALGITVGSIVHTTTAALGLSAFLATSIWAFSAVKSIGGAYLVFLGICALLSSPGRLHLPSRFAGTETAAAFRQGILTNVLNPKVALFVLACFASALSEKLRDSTTIATMLNRAVGSLFVFLGMRLAVSR